MNYLYAANVDYTELTNYTVTLNSSNVSVTVNIEIRTNDTEQVEQDEYFTVHLSFSGDPIPGVTLDPNKTTVEIIEFDGEGTYNHICTKVSRLPHCIIFPVANSWVLFSKIQCKRR